MVTPEDVRSVSPALEKYTRERLLGDVWKRPGLSSRDRSVVTLSSLIARNQTVELPFHVSLALDNGVHPREISEIITHLAFYSGWANATAAVGVAKEVFAQRRIAATSCRLRRLSPLRWTRQPRPSAPRLSSSSSDRPPPVRCRTRRSSSSVSSGCVPTLLLATEVS